MNKPGKYGVYISLYILFCGIAVFLVFLCAAIIDKIGVNSTYIYGFTVILLIACAIYITHNLTIVVRDYYEHNDGTMDNNKKFRIQLLKLLYIIPAGIFLFVILVFIL